ncbi:MAG: DUF3857 domain-containing protein [Candidatus Omnitrophota bacterium]
MRITDINNNPKVKPLISFFFVLLATILLPLPSLCAIKNKVESAQGAAIKAENYYRQAVEGYERLIAEGKDLERLHFELGRLYFSHGEFQKASQELRKTDIKGSAKLLGISFYHLGNFTDALEVFNKNSPSDDEYLYYQGMTYEKLNLFDQALGVYKKIKDKTCLANATLRINAIEKESGTKHIKDLSPDIYRALTRAPSASQYPQAGALILSCDERIEVSPDYKQVSYLHYLIKILNERGKEAFSETQIEYDSTYEKVELEYARTIKPDGTIVDVGSRHIRDVSKYLNFPLYSNVRVFIISFPEIAGSSCIEYKVRIYRNELINKKEFVLTYPLQGSEPLIHADFSISTPKERPLHIKSINEKYNDFGAVLSPDIKEHNGMLSYRWSFKNIPQIVPEPSMPGPAMINPAMLISTFNDWKEIYDWWSKLSQDKINADAAIKNKVKELTKAGGAEGKIRAIYNFCAKEIRYVAVEYGQAGYEPHHACDIFKNKYGDCKDQAILLVTMLREAGFSAYPVLIPTKDYYDLNEDFPSMLFNHCIAAVLLESGIVFLDPTAETCSFGDLPSGDQGRKVLLVDKENYRILSTPLYPASHNLVKQELKLKVNDDETIDAQKSVGSSGIYDQAQRYWLLYTQPELIQQALSEKIQEISIGAKLINYDIMNVEDLNKPVVLRYAFRGPEYFTTAGPLRIMPQLTSADASLVAKEKRKYPIDFSILDSKETKLSLEIPGNFKVKYLPQGLTEDSPWIKLVVDYGYSGNNIYFSQKVELKKAFIPESEYPEFKNYLEKLAKKIKQRIVLEKVE